MGLQRRTLMTLLVSAAALVGVVALASGGGFAHRSQTGSTASRALGKAYLADTETPVEDFVGFSLPAGKVKEHVFSKDLEGYTFAEPRGVGVNQTTGDVYVSDGGINPVAIEQFNAEGALQSSTTLPVGSGETTFQVTVDNACYAHSLTGSACTSFDPSDGDVYIADVTDGVVYKFDPNANGELTLDATTPKIPKEGEPVLGEPRGVAVDSSGNVYITSGGSVSEFSATGELLHENLITGVAGPRGLAIDAAGNIYVAGEIFFGAVEYSSTGACVNSCKPFNTEFDRGIAVDPAGDVFISDVENGTIHEYGHNAERSPIHSPLLEEANAVAGPNGIAVNDTSHVLYVVEASGAKVVKVFAPIEAKPTTVTTEPATQVRGAVEALRGTINPGAEATEYYFEYGTAPCNAVADTCGTVAIEQSEVPLHGEEALPVSVSLENLAPDTQYHYWLVGVHEESGVERGAELTFTTGHSEPSPGPAGGTTPQESKTPASYPVFPLLTSIAPVPLPKPPVKKTVTRAQHLAKALAACNRKPKKQRAACRRQARSKYGSAAKGVKKKKK
jgi:DNA-binding beta-propeller fold protein YncE